MAKKSQLPLLACFIKDKVRLTISLVSSVQLPDGEMASAPLILEGFLLDHDDTFVLLGQEERDNLELIAIKSIIALSQILPEDEAYEDPSRPPTQDMN